MERGVASAVASRWRWTGAVVTSAHSMSVDFEVRHKPPDEKGPMFHTVAFAFNGTPARTANQLLAVPAVQDQLFSASGANAFLLPAEMKVVAGFAFSNSLRLARMNSP